jgi:anti-sigma factor RsiW
MIRYVGCDYARPRLDAFVDGELPMGDQVLVETHLRWCQTCAARLEDSQRIGESLRLTARAHSHEAGPTDTNDRGGLSDDLSRSLAAMQAEVLAQANTEYEQSFSARVEELFSDMRLWWPALGATVAVALSAGVASNVWKATSTEQPASLAAIIENLADPGSNRNPQRLDAAMYLPRVLDDGLALDGAMLAQHTGDNHQDEVLAVAAIITREGKISGYALLDEQGVMRQMPVSGPLATDGEVEGVLHAVRQSRFAPAQRPGGQVVAVNMVWLFARTTVKASHQAVDLGMPLPRPALAVPPPVAKPVQLAPEGASSQEHSQDKADDAPMGSATA